LQQERNSGGILVVEDDQDDQKISTHILEKQRYDVTQTENGTNPIALLKK
tara:strand:+ start:204 stop:353 length:150 start_codon:yes stop_codon:yes gene_type:complete